LTFICSCVRGRLALRLEDRDVDVEIAAADAERFDERIDDAGRLGVRLVDAAERDARQRAFAVVRVGVALDVLERERGQPLAGLGEHRDDGGALRLAVGGVKLRGFDKRE
jgi:hypothetical protein